MGSILCEFRDKFARRINELTDFESLFYRERRLKFTIFAATDKKSPHPSQISIGKYCVRIPRLIVKFESDFVPYFPKIRFENYEKTIIKSEFLSYRSIIAKNKNISWIFGKRLFAEKIGNFVRKDLGKTQISSTDCDKALIWSKDH